MLVTIWLTLTLVFVILNTLDDHFVWDNPFIHGGYYVFAGTTLCFTIMLLPFKLAGY